MMDNNTLAEVQRLCIIILLCAQVIVIVDIGKEITKQTEILIYVHSDK